MSEGVALKWYPTRAPNVWRNRALDELFEEIHGIESVPCFDRGKFGRAWACLAIHKPCVFAVCINTTPSKWGEVLTCFNVASCYIPTFPRSACPIDFRAASQKAIDARHPWKCPPMVPISTRRRFTSTSRVWRNLCSDRVAMSFHNFPMPPHDFFVFTLLIWFELWKLCRMHQDVPRI